MTNTIHWHRRKYTEEQFREAIQLSKTWSQVAKALGANNRNYKAYVSTANYLRIDTSHFEEFTPTRPYSNRQKIPMSGYLVRGSTLHTGAKKRLFTEGFLEEKCSSGKCPVPSKFENPFTGEVVSLKLEIDHIDGDSTNNTIENLRALCVLCHSYTDTWKSKNSKRAKANLAQKKCNCGNSKSYRSKSCRKCAIAFSRSASPKRDRRVVNYTKARNLCECGESKQKDSKQCKACYDLAKLANTKVDWPSTQELLDRVKATSYTQVGKELGVSDNAVRKRIKNHPIV